MLTPSDLSKITERPCGPTVLKMAAEIERLWKIEAAAKLIQHHSAACREEHRGKCCCGLAQLREVLK